MELLTKLLSVDGPHHGAPVFHRGDITQKKALILLHGRGGSAFDIQSLTEALPGEVYTLIPEAVGRTWYPERFLLPQMDNQPALDSALQVLTNLIWYVDSLGISKEQVVLAGFSQGACLASEYIKQNPLRYGGVVLMSGGFIGTDTEAKTLPKPGSLLGTPVYIGCDRADAHIPLERVLLTTTGLEQAGAVVQQELFEDYGHQPHPSALTYLQTLVSEG